MACKFHCTLVLPRQTSGKWEEEEEAEDNNSEEEEKQQQWQKQIDDLQELDGTPTGQRFTKARRRRIKIMKVKKETEINKTVQRTSEHSSLQVSPPHLVCRFSLNSSPSSSPPSSSSSSSRSWARSCASWLMRCASCRWRCRVAYLMDSCSVCSSSIISHTSMARNSRSDRTDSCVSQRRWNETERLSRGTERKAQNGIKIYIQLQGKAENSVSKTQAGWSEGGDKRLSSCRIPFRQHRQVGQEAKRDYL